MRLFGRIRHLVITALLLSGLALVSCTLGNANNRDEDYLGEFSYDAPIIAMVYEDLDGEGKGILYRSVTDFDKFINNTDKPVLIYMYTSMHADDAGTTASVEQMAEDYHDELVVVAVDLFRASEIANLYEIAAVPEFIIINSGQEVSRFDSASKQTWYPEEVSDWMISVIDTIE